jgi:hypothetical protein
MTPVGDIPLVSQWSTSLQSSWSPGFDPVGSSDLPFVGRSDLGEGSSPLPSVGSGLVSLWHLPVLTNRTASLSCPVDVPLWSRDQARHTHLLRRCRGLKPLGPKCRSPASWRCQLGLCPLMATCWKRPRSGLSPGAPRCSSGCSPSGWLLQHLLPARELVLGAGHSVGFQFVEPFCIFRIFRLIAYLKTRFASCLSSHLSSARVIVSD